MKLLDLLPPVIKAIVATVVFFISIGWAAYGGVLLIVRAEGKDIREDVSKIRQIDQDYLDKRFNKLESLIKEQRN